MATTFTEVAVTDGAAVGVSPPAGSYRIQVQPSVNVRARFDGTDPTSSVGIRLVADSFAEFDETELRKASFRSESGSGVLRVLYYSS